MKKEIILFGAGKYGVSALNSLGIERIAYFIDNNANLHGTFIQGKEIKPVNKGIEESDKYTILVCSLSWRKMCEQLEASGCSNYEVYEGLKMIYPTEELVFNPYFSDLKRNLSEENFIKEQRNSKMIDSINQYTDELYNNPKLFDSIEIETINRCNGSCDFCPVNKDRDIRELKVMTEELFRSIIDQLAIMNYAGRISLFSNNEPFLDDTIIEKHKYAREMLPNARFHLYTNGTLLSLDKFIEIVKYLDELIIDNYNQELKLIKPCKKIVEYCEEHSELKKKVTIVLRKPHEILTTRGGDAPNRSMKASFSDVKCVLPFKQLIIRPDGKISLCCNDPLGKNTLGDLNKESIIDAWNNDRFKTIRECLYKGRGFWNHCKYCDSLNCG